MILVARIVFSVSKFLVVVGAIEYIVPGLSYDVTKLLVGGMF